MASCLPIKILLVEDDTDMVNLMVMTFERHNAEVVCASNGADGLCEIIQTTKTRPFDLIVLDVAMRYVEGIAFVRALRCLEENEVVKGHTHVMLHTAHVEAFENGKLLKGLDLTAVDCYLKPNDTLKLVEDVNARIHQPSEIGS